MGQESLVAPHTTAVSAAEQANAEPLSQFNNAIKKYLAIAISMQLRLLQKQILQAKLIQHISKTDGRLDTQLSKSVTNRTKRVAAD